MIYLRNKFRGQSMLEYVLLTTLVAVVVFSAFQFGGNSTVRQTQLQANQLFEYGKQQIESTTYITQ